MNLSPAALRTLARLSEVTSAIEASELNAPDFETRTKQLSQIAAEHFSDRQNKVDDVPSLLRAAAIAVLMVSLSDAEET